MTISTKSLQGGWIKNEVPEEGQLRVWCIVNPPDPGYIYPVDSVDEAAEVINREANIQLSDPAVGANVFGLQVFEGGEWVEWEDEDGNDIDFYCDEKEE